MTFCPNRRAATVATLLAILLAGAGGARAAAGGAADGHVLELSATRPPCSGQAGLPIVPDDPAAITDASGRRRCYGTRPPVLALSLPEGRWVWLDNVDTSPAAWIAVGPVLVDADEIESPVLGLRLTEADDGPVLESRYARSATLAPLRAGEWQAVRLADGRRVWVRVAGRAPSAQ